MECPSRRGADWATVFHRCGLGRLLAPVAENGESQVVRTRRDPNVCETPDQTRSKLSALTYRLADFPRRLALPRTVKRWSLTTLQQKLVEIGAEVTRHSKYVTFQLVEVVVTWNPFVAIPDRVTRLALPPPVVAGCGR